MIDSDTPPHRPGARLSIPVARLILLIGALLFALPGAGARAQGHDPDAASAEMLVADTAVPTPAGSDAAPEPEAPYAPGPQSASEPQAAPQIAPQDEDQPASAEATSTAPQAPAPEASPLPTELPPTIVSSGILVDGLQYDIAMPWGHGEFEDLRAYYLSSGGIRWLKTVMEKSLPYIGYVEAKIGEMGLPRELAYLPIIESEYSPYAVSRSGATGIWQFMRNSIAGYNLSISDWLDDRKDFMKSTDAALSKLQDNFKALGDWPLAIAAYNAGLGAVSRAIKSSSGEDIDFWHLYESRKLSREPLSYVPKFLAIASILRYPELHGLPSYWGDPHEWVALTTDRQVDLAVLAERASIPLDILKKGNAELRYGVTPPIQGHMVKVPADKADSAEEVLKDTTSPLFRYDIYTVRSGDTLGAVAKRYGTALSLILQANKGLNPDKIRIGQTILIPKFSGTAGGSASAGVSSGTATGASGGASARLDANGYYTVARGDTLWEIGQKFSTTPSRIAAANGIGVGSVLRIGQKLKIPGN